ncbi:MAG: ansR3 [Bacilli bacterium]|nr:ansR3 [Bacilli bacterium]
MENRVREVRREKNIPGTEVAELLNITPQYYYEIERGKKRLSAEMAARLAEYFGVTVDYLLGVSEYRFGRQMIIDTDKHVIRESTAQEEKNYLESNKIYAVRNALKDKIEEVHEENDPDEVIIAKELESIKESYPHLSRSRDIKDLKKFLEQSEIMFDGVPMTDEDKARIQGYMESMFWDAKQKNKRKKTTDE